MNTKKILSIICTFSIVIFSSQAFADVLNADSFVVPNSADDEIVIEDSSSAGVDIMGNELSFSSGVEARYSGSDTEYVAATQNTQAGENIKVYATTSAESLLYVNQTEDSWPGATVSDVDWSTDNWTVLGD
jgi:hypothetical protein